MKPILQAHHRVFAGFFLYSFCLGGFFPRLAELQHTMGVTEGQLGLGLIGTAVGTLVSLTFGGRWIERLGHRGVLLGLTPIVPIFYAIAAHATGPLALFLCLFPAGLLIGLVEIVVNLEADRVEHQGGVRIMNRAHAFWSLGFFGAGLLGTLAARVGLSPQWHLALVVPLAAVLTWTVLSGFQPAPHRPQAEGGAEGTEGEGGAAARMVRPSRTILLLVALVLSAMVMEGAGIDWSAIYMRDVFESSAVVSGLAVTLGALSQALARYFADGYVERYSPIAVARTLLVILLIGVLMVFFARAPWMALLGFALMGVGTSVMFPLAMSAAAQLTDKPAAVNVAALAQTSFVSFFLAPPLLGFVAEHAGIRWAFGIGLPLVLLSLALSGILRRR